MTRWTVRAVPSLSGYAVEWADADGLLLSRGNRLYHATAPGETPRLYTRVPAPGWKAAVARIRLGERL